jgi:hypothetical protein
MNNLIVLVLAIIMCLVFITQLPEVSAGYLRGYGYVMSIIRSYFKQNFPKVW